MNPALLPLAVTCTALYLGLGLLPFVPDGISWGDALGLLPSRLTADGFPVLPLLLALPLGFFWLGTLWPRAASARPVAAVAVFLALGLLAVLLLLGQIYFPPRLAVPGGLLAPLLGFAAGITLWWLLAPLLSRRLPALPTWLWPLLVVCATGSVLLLPLVIGAPLGAPALPGSLSGYVLDVPQRIYLLIKSAILWVPVGFLYTLSGRGVALPRWGIALFAAWVVEGLPLLWNQPLREILELLFALPGLWAGAWMGERTRLVESRPASALSTSAGLTMPAAVAPDRLPALVRKEGRGSTFSRTAVGHTGFADKAAPTGDDVIGPVAALHAIQVRSARHSFGIVLGLGLLALAVIGLYDFPRWQVVLVFALVLYFGALWFQPLAWLVVIPAALPLLDLAPWTGRFFFDEFDLLMLVTVGTLLLRGRDSRAAPLARGAGLLIGLFTLALLVSLLVGLLPLPNLDANAFSSYWSPYNALRVAKGFLWGGLMFWLVRRAGIDTGKLGRLLAIGTGLGLLGVGAVGVWERWLFTGFADPDQTYRIVSTFSSMHTGGGHIEAWLVAALPFLWLGAFRLRHLALVVPLMVLGAYVMLYTVARGGVLALAVAMLILLAGSVRLTWRKESSRRTTALLAPVALVLALTGIVAVGIGGGYFQQRMAQSGQDWQIRVDHWARALDMRDASVSAQLFGMGLGSFPRSYLQRGPADNQPATFAFVTESGNTFLRLGSGETMYYAQRVPVAAGQTYRMELQARASSAARIDTPVCEKQMLNSRQCVWFGFDVPGDGQWHRLTREFSSAKVGEGGVLGHPPVELVLHHADKTGRVDVDSVRLIGPDGRDLLSNGDFAHGGDCWFFKTHSHLPWHIKNVWVHVLFEQGWLGLLAFASLTALALTRLARAGWRGHRLAWAWFASLAGLLTVGMFDSLLDAPRLATLLVALILLGVGYEWEPSNRSKRHRRRRHATVPEKATDWSAETA